MDEVRVRRLIQKYSDDGELDRADPALMMLKEWPSSQLYIDNPRTFQGSNSWYVLLERMIYIQTSKLNHKYFISCHLFSGVVSSSESV